MMGRKVSEPKLYVSFSLDSVVPARHLVRQLAEAIDFEFVHELVRGCYSRTGKPSVDPIVLFKLWLLGYLHGITSERRLCEEASLNLAWRWFLGYELDEALPDHSVLTKARRRFGVRIYELFFRRIVKLCDERGLVQGDVLFLDSTLTDADASHDTLRSRALLNQLKDPAQYVRDLEMVNDPPPMPEPPRAKDPRGAKPGRTPNPSWRANLASTTDPDAELATRRNGRRGLAHKTQVAVDGGKANIITAIDVGPAGDSDASTVGRMLDKHEINLGRAARELVGDSGYGTDGGYRACLARGVRATLKTPSRVRSKTQFGADQFTYVRDRDIFICPAGRELHRFKDLFEIGKAVYQPVQAGVCGSCPLKARCIGGKDDRTVKRNWDADVLQAAQAHLSTPRGRARFRRRQVVSERTMAELKCHHGFDRAQFRGRASVQIQALLTATALNIKQLLKRHLEAQSGWAQTPLQAGTDLLCHLLLAAWLTVQGPIWTREPSWT